MPAPARKNAPDNPPVVENPPDDTADDTTADDTTAKDSSPEVEEMNPVVVPDGWEAVPEVDGGGIRPTQVPWPGYESA